MITKILYDRLYRLATLRRFTTEDAKELQAVIQSQINSSYSVCLRCAAQLKHGQKIILNYLNSVQVLDELPSVVEPVLLTDVLPDPEVDVEEAVKSGCAKCGKKKIKS